MQMEFLDDNSFLWTSERDGFAIFVIQQMKTKTSNQRKLGSNGFLRFNPKNTGNSYKPTKREASTK